MKTACLTLIIVMIALSACASAFARVELVVVPQRENVRIRLGGANTGVGEGVATVQEERVITLDEGRNRLDLAWVGIAIDPASLRLEAAEGAALEVVSLSFPPGSADAVRWDVTAPKAGQYGIRISYTVRGLNWTREYTLLASEDENSASLVGFAKIFNRSGEDFTDALIDMGVGEPVTRSFMNGETIQVPILAADGVPIEKTYTWDPAKYQTDQVVMHYVIRNDGASKLGLQPLPRGSARIFLRKGDTRTFVGEDWLNYTPLGEKAELYVGAARDITVKRNPCSENGWPTAAYPHPLPTGEGAFGRCFGTLQSRNRPRRPARPVFIPLCGPKGHEGLSREAAQRTRGRGEGGEDSSHLDLRPRRHMLAAGDDDDSVADVVVLRVEVYAAARAAGDGRPLADAGVLVNDGALDPAVGADPRRRAAPDPRARGVQVGLPVVVVPHEDAVLHPAARLQHPAHADDAALDVTAADDRAIADESAVEARVVELRRREVPGARVDGPGGVVKVEAGERVGEAEVRVVEGRDRPDVLPVPEELEGVHPPIRQRGGDHLPPEVLKARGLKDSPERVRPEGVDAHGSHVRERPAAGVEALSRIRKGELIEQALVPRLLGERDHLVIRLQLHDAHRSRLLGAYRLDGDGDVRAVVVVMLHHLPVVHAAEVDRRRG
jgi:hypothetical protein